MKRVICDHCRKEEPPNEYGMAPKGWLKVDVSGTYTPVKDFCTLTCAIAALTEAAAPPEPVPPAPSTEATVQ